MILESIGYFFLMLFAVLGGGGILLSITGVIHRVEAAESLAIAFPLGMGFLGWITFYVALSGHITQFDLTILLFILILGNYVFKGLFPLKSLDFALLELRQFGIWRLLLICGFILILTLDLAEALAPPVDGDTMAYHFSLPKMFLRSGELVPVIQAVEGAIPLLLHMTYLVAFGTGGELTLTLWTGATGYAVTILIFIILKRFVDINWALAFTLLFATTPAVLYSAGSGHIEVRNAAFVLLAVFSASEAIRMKQWRLVILAGIAAGFFAASKYTGLIFAFACCVALLYGSGRFKWAALFCICLFFSGHQWYVWNFWNTGDPFFPILFDIVEYNTGVSWNADIHAAYQLMIEEKAIQNDLLGFFLYPFKATLAPHPIFESLRVGFGPTLLLMLPLALFAIWNSRSRVHRHPLFIFFLICLISYGTWFFLGPSQRIRHLLPIYPLVFICVVVSCHRLVVFEHKFTFVLSSILLMVIPLQIAGMVVYSSNILEYLTTNEDRTSFLLRNISQYNAAIEANDHLSSSDVLLVAQRQLIYHFNTPVFYAHPNQQAEVEIHANAKDPRKFWKQLQKKGISHLLLHFHSLDQPRAGAFEGLARTLYQAQCLVDVKTFTARDIVSRTLPSLGHTSQKFSLAKLMPGQCPY